MPFFGTGSGDPDEKTGLESVHAELDMKKIRDKKTGHLKKRSVKVTLEFELMIAGVIYPFKVGMAKTVDKSVSIGALFKSLAKSKEFQKIVDINAAENADSIERIKNLRIKIGGKDVGTARDVWKMAMDNIQRIEILPALGERRSVPVTNRHRVRG